MENKKHQFKVEFKKKGVENPDYKDIKTMDDFFKMAHSLNKKDTKKLLKELGDSIQIYRFMCAAAGGKPLTTKIWQWSND